MIPTKPPDVGVCPFLDKQDARCGSHFTLSRLNEAFDHCFGAYTSCPNFHRLARENPKQLIWLSVHGRSFKATGT